MLLRIAHASKMTSPSAYVAVAEWNDLIAFQVLVSAEPNVVAALLCDGCGAVTVDDGCIEQTSVEKSLHRAREVVVDAAISHPAPEGPVDARVVNFHLPI